MFCDCSKRFNGDENVAALAPAGRLAGCLYVPSSLALRDPNPHSRGPESLFWQSDWAGQTSRWPVERHSETSGPLTRCPLVLDLEAAAAGM